MLLDMVNVLPYKNIEKLRKKQENNLLNDHKNTVLFFVYKKNEYSQISYRNKLDIKKN